MDLSPTAQVTASSSPTPGDARGAFSVGAFDATTLLPESYSSEGPTDDGRLKPDIAAPTNVLITPGDPESEAINACGGTSCATPHVGGAAALIWGRGGGRRRRRAASRSACATASWLRRSTSARPGPTPSSAPAACGSTSPRRCSGRRSPRPNSLVRGTVALSLPIADAGTLGLLQLTVDGTPLVATLAPGGILQASWPTAGLAPGPHVLVLIAADLSGNVATYRLTLNVDNDAPRVRLRAPQHAHQGDKVRISASVRDAGSGLAGRPRIEFGDGAAGYGFRLAHRYKRAGRYVVTMRATDRAGNTTLVRRALRVRVPAARGGRAVHPG